jgi:hypothetical protein
MSEFRWDEEAETDPPMEGPSLIGESIWLLAFVCILIIIAIGLLGLPLQ